MTEADAFTGERFLPGVVGEIAYEHCHRYAFARRFVAGRRVLDAACGEGYGSALLAEAADTVIGVDIDAQVVAKAAATYGKSGKLSFEAASVNRLPLTDASVDVVVSFETIEHLKAVDQPPMLAEFARVLAPGGILILSSPNRLEYSDARGYANPFHFHELDRDELSQLLQPRFAAQRWFHQRRYLGSAIWSETPGERFEALAGSAADVGTAAVPPAMYFIVIAASASESLPPEVPTLSLYADGEDAEWKRIDHEAREVLRLDGLLVARDEMLRAQYRHSEELQAMVAHRDQVLAERTHAEEIARQELLSTFTAEQERLTRQIEAQERIIGYRESVRWWLALPWLRARRLWNRIRAA
ncbi:MAG TPA: class I SAM-dependent methyltransferase [Casimicrobiaceae bacterium]|nr:class I SAM-dependent methyltransferase [Casimicrobiaceae bacterium]